MHVLDEPQSSFVEFPPGERDAARIVTRLRYALGTAFVVLLASTWKLWIPQQEFPRIPLLTAARSLPPAVEWLLAAVMLASLGVVVGARGSSRWWRQGLIGFSVALLGLILCDQQRLQTWAYQFALMAPVLAIVPARYAVPLLRVFAASIYMHSALSKLSMTFLNSTGPALVAGLLKAMQLSIPVQNSVYGKAFEVMLPLGELTVAVLLLLRATRWYGLWLSIVMHLLLLLALGPLGLNNRPGVLIWNIYFVLQNVILFGPLVRGSARPRSEDVRLTPEPMERSTPRYTVSAWGVVVLITAAILLPFLEPFGRFDHWPSWAVYAGSAERIKVYVRIEQLARLPESLRKRTLPVPAAPDWNRVLIDRWALDVLSAPIYPEDRFQLGTAFWIAQHFEADDAIMVVVESRATRLEDERLSRVLNGRAEIEKELETFWWNARPREL
ncbi:MAG: hypothetical protein AB7O26_07535 [Planctomycetaceae bacterium]